MDEVKQYALKLGFDTCKPVGDWQGYKVYIVSDSKETGDIIGLPCFLLAKNGNIRNVTDPKEINAIMRVFSESGDEEE